MAALVSAAVAEINLPNSAGDHLYMRKAAAFVRVV